jgi:hypothetical protein
MERRDFIHSVALTTLAVLGEKREAMAASDVRLTAAQMDGHLRQLDAHLHWMGTRPMDPWFELLERAPSTGAAAGARWVIPAAARPRCEALLRKVLRSLYLARTFRDLPEHGRAHPGMQQRIAAALPEMDAAVRGAREYLVGLSAADRLDLQRMVQEDPEVLPRLAHQLDSGGEAAGLPPGGRGQVSSQILHLDRQLRRSDAGVILGEYVARADQAAAQAGTYEEVSNRLRDHLGAPAFYTLQQRQAELARLWWEQPPPASYPGAGEIYHMGAEPIDESVRHHRHSQLVAGAIVLGIGVVLTVPGLAFVTYTVGLSSIAATPGVGMLIAGAVLLGLGSRRSS